MGFTIAFWLLAILSVVSALAVVLLPNIFRAALTLALCFLAVAGLYVLLSADFLAAVQVLIYVGAVAILILLAVMLTREVTTGSPPNKLRVPAFILSFLLLLVLVYSFLSSPWAVSVEPPPEQTTSILAAKLFGEQGFILPVEVAAVLLLVSALGAIVLVREKEGKWK
jgi:NADH-quinone oxidoreductase subunit J